MRHLQGARTVTPPGGEEYGWWSLVRLWLPRRYHCTTMSYMKSATVTIRLDAKLERELTRLSRQLGRSRSDLVRDALRRQLALARFEQARRALLPLAEAQGFLTDEDVFADVS